jgi:hypothetical protein
MNVHQNARLTPSGRALLAERVERGWPQTRLEGVAAQGKRPLAAASRDRRIAPPPAPGEAAMLLGYHHEDIGVRKRNAVLRAHDTALP